MENKVVCVDLDGTLADINHRLPLIQCDPPNWDLFYSSCYADKPNEWCVSLIHAMITIGHKVMIVSARSKSVESTTLNWLHTKTPLSQHLNSGDLTLNMIRLGNKDYTPDQELKRNWLHSFGKEKILFIVDDRSRVVRMWREEGIICLQCQEWAEFVRPKKGKKTP